MFADWVPGGLALPQLGAIPSRGAAPQLRTDVVVELFGWLAVTNTMLAGTLVTAILILVAGLLRLSLSQWPSRAQVAAESLVDGLLGLAESAGGSHARRFVPLVGTAFVFILAANWLGALPLAHVSVANPAGEAVAMLRTATSDLNLTAAIALIVVLFVEAVEIQGRGPLRYLKSLVVPNPMRWLEMLVRPLSLGFRLFGSAFAGHVLVGTMLAIAPIVVIPFLVLELFMGLIQAIIFAALTLVFLAIATVHQDQREPG